LVKDDANYTTIRQNNNESFLKLTINKFYRVTGKSNQALGITPNVPLLPIYETVYPKESNSPSSLKMTA
jgi:carboxyl-terminal processing protease